MVLCIKVLYKFFINYYFSFYWTKYTIFALAEFL